MSREERMKTADSMEHRTVGEFVAEDYRTAKVFEKYGIDFCCGGKVPLAAACPEKGVALAVIRGEIEEATSEPVEQSQNFAAWGLPFLSDYIITGISRRTPHRSSSTPAR